MFLLLKGKVDSTESNNGYTQTLIHLSFKKKLEALEKPLRFVEWWPLQEPQKAFRTCIPMLLRNAYAQSINKHFLIC